MAAPSFASFLSSPTIRLILPSAPEDKTYTIHRSILASQTALLKSQRTRNAYILLDQSAVTVPTVEYALEYLYTADYVLPAQDASSSAAANGDDSTLLETSRPAAHLPQDSPLLAAAMAGSIGVWGRAAPRFDAAENTSTYTSIYFPAEDRRKKVQIVTSGLKEEQQQTQTLLPSPPASPVFQAYEPVLALKGAAKKLEEKKNKGEVVAPAEVVPYDVACLRAHIAVWRFADAPGVGIPGLAKLALEKLTALFEAAAGDRLTRLVEEMVGAVFCCPEGRPEETVLRVFVVGKVVGRIAELSRRKEFNEFIRRGGEFVVDVLGSLADVRDGC